MNPLVEQSRDNLLALCSEHRVIRLEVFGSGSGEDFDETRSDLDFLVVFEPCTPQEHAKRYFALLAALQDLFDRDIDLVELSAVRNPYLLAGIEKTRTMVYGA